VVEGVFLVEIVEDIHLALLFLIKKKIFLAPKYFNPLISSQLKE
jgi:hypothetical protein